jgi:hypothetical protein
MKPAAPVALALAAVTLAACGSSTTKQEAATSAVCGARADIRSQIDQIHNMVIAPSTPNGVKVALTQIGTDLTTIKGQQGALAPQRRQQVMTANQTFTAQVQKIASGLGTTLSQSTAQAQFTAARNQLESAYAKALSPISC